MNILELPPELLEKILVATGSISDVLCTCEAFSIQFIGHTLLSKSFLWTCVSLGPRYLVATLPYVGPHTRRLSVTGPLRLDTNLRPTKERFFKSAEFVPGYLLNTLSSQCCNLTHLTFHKCVFGPHTKSSALPKSVKILNFRSVVFVRKVSFFTDIWTNLPHLEELRIENLLNFNKSDCYAVLSSASIDFDIQFSNHHKSPTFVFFRKKAGHLSSNWNEFEN